jgi:glyoxylase-like metal-dependent hydrolase (beta-lactamase superfamily II)
MADGTAYGSSTYGGSTYEVIAIKYGTYTGWKAETYLNFPIYGEPDEPQQMDYFCWVARNDERVIVIDTGFDPAAGSRRKRTLLADPVEALAWLGLDAVRLPQVIVTHAHYDHIGNLSHFPSAEVVLTRAEFDFWTGPYRRREQFAWSSEESEIDYLNRVRYADDRATLLDGPRTVAPGVEVVPVGGHTPGQAIVLIGTASGQTVLASDAVHFYAELERDRPLADVTDLLAMYRGFDLLREITAESGRVLVPGHDPEVISRFPAIDGIEDGLAVRVG